jgi:gamma-glutamyltranspeptidase/glutathione hydrolase
MVVTPQPEATETGRDILVAGGNAIDAAIATALVQTVVDPLMCGIAGFGSLAAYLPSKNVHTYYRPGGCTSRYVGVFDRR